MRERVEEGRKLRWLEVIEEGEITAEEWGEPGRLSRRRRRRTGEAGDELRDLLGRLGNCRKRQDRIMERRWERTGQERR